MLELSAFFGLLLGVPLAYFIPDLLAFGEEFFGVALLRGTYFDTLPVDLRWMDIVVIVIASLLITLFASAYPAWQAAQRTPVAGLDAA